MVPDSAPWKDDGLENSDKNNYKCGLSLTLNSAQDEPVTPAAQERLTTLRTCIIDTSIIQTRTTESRQRMPRVRYIQSLYRM